MFGFLELFFYAKKKRNCNSNLKMDDDCTQILLTASIRREAIFTFYHAHPWVSSLETCDGHPEDQE